MSISEEIKRMENLPVLLQTIYVRASVDDDETPENKQKHEEFLKLCASIPPPDIDAILKRLNEESDDDSDDSDDSSDDGGEFVTRLMNDILIRETAPEKTTDLPTMVNES